MTRYKVVIEYVGTYFHGWQRQKSSISIQETIEKAAKKLFQEQIQLTVAGRTDAGVHAIGQVAHLDTKKNICPNKVLLGLNFFLLKEKFGEEISIKKVRRVSRKFNARFSAVKKIYQYKILNKTCRSPLNQNDSWWVKNNLDVQKMINASYYLIGKHDFSSFRAAGCQSKSPIKTLDKIQIKRKQFIISFKFTAKSFLYNQVRIMVGTLKGVGEGLIKVERVNAILKEKKRDKAGTTAPAKGLTLVKVNYK